MRTLVYIFLFLVLCKSVYALRINEIYPAPQQSNFEWVELYNESDQIINLLNFELTDETGKTLIFATESAQAHSYVTATSSGVLNNSGDTVILKTTSENELERVTYPANIDATHSYTFCENTLWTVQNITLGSENSSCISPIPTPTLQPTIVPISTNAPSPTPNIQIQNIYINEFIPNPSEGPEWIELYNDNDSDLMLSNWYIDDVADAGSSPYLFTISINKHAYATIQLKSAMLNNSGDRVRLLDTQKQEVDTTSYNTSLEDKSVSKQKDGAWCITNMSSGYENNECLVTATVTPSSIRVSPTIHKQPNPTSLETTQNRPKQYPVVTLSLAYTKAHNKTTPVPQVLGISSAAFPPVFYFFSLLSLASSCVSGSLFALQFRHE